MDNLRQGIGLRSLGQRDPVVEYKFAGYDMFNDMTAAIREDTVKLLLRIKVEQKIEREANPAARKSRNTSKMKSTRTMNTCMVKCTDFRLRRKMTTRKFWTVAGDSSVMTGSTSSRANAKLTSMIELPRTTGKNKPNISAHSVWSSHSRNLHYQQTNTYRNG